jgi:hypothetical protein
MMWWSATLGLADMPSAGAALRDFARVAKIGGQVRCTMPLAGTFTEFYDIYREVLVKHDRPEAIARLDAHLAAYPTPARCEQWLAEAGLEPVLEVEEFSLLFRSSREFFFAPVIEFGPLPAWKAIAGAGQELQDVFWYIKEAIDAYFDGRPFEVTVKAACLGGRKLSEAIPAPSELPPHGPIADGSVRLADSDVIDIEEISEQAEAELMADTRDTVDVPLDAFTDGKARPPHL